MSGLRLSRILDLADAIYPFDSAEPWDNVGLQIGDPNRIVERIAFSLDPSRLTLDFAARNHCHLLITHHPIILSPVKQILATDHASRIIMCAVKMNVDVLSLHTNLDAAVGGLNDHLAQSIKLEDVLTPPQARCSRMGSLTNPVSLHTFADYLVELLQIPSVHVIAKDNPVVKKIFCVAGSGMGYLSEALNMGADVMVTGDVRYHAAVEAIESGMAVIDCGHFHLEKAAPKIMAGTFKKALEEINAHIECLVCEEEKDPFSKQYIGEEDLN